jgi:hypothetical protein
VDAAIGAPLFVEADGLVGALFVGSGAAFGSELYLASPPNGLGVIFDTAVDVPGAAEILGFAPAGTPLTFGIHVTDSLLTTTYDFFSGAVSGDPAGVPHAAVADADDLPAAVLAAFPILVGTILVGFEDVPFGHPFFDADYNDVVFAFSNLAAPAAIPEPTSLLLFGTGAVALLARARRRKK